MTLTDALTTAIVAIRLQVLRDLERRNSTRAAAYLVTLVNLEAHLRDLGGTSPRVEPDPYRPAGKGHFGETLYPCPGCATLVDTAGECCLRCMKLGRKSR